MAADDQRQPSEDGRDSRQGEKAEGPVPLRVRTLSGDERRALQAADRAGAGRLGSPPSRRHGEAEKRAEEVIHFAEVPQELGREFRVRGRCGVVELKFPTNSSAIRTVDRRYSTTLLMNKTTYVGYFQVHGSLVVNGAEFPKSVSAPLRASFRGLTARKVEGFKRSAEILDLLRKREFSSRVEWINKDIRRACDWAPEGKVPSPDTCWLRAQRQVLERTGCDP